jgi:hypothetical protein
VRGRRAESRELLYLAITESDERVRRDPRYRVGAVLNKRYGSGATVAFFGVIGAAAIPLGWLAGETVGLNAAGKILVALWGVAGVLGLYCWWFFVRQEWSERGRAYRLRRVEPEDDVEIADAKRSLLTRGSSAAEREQALVLLLSRGACSPNRFSAARELLGWLMAVSFVALFFVVIAWLT